LQLEIDDGEDENIEHEDDFLAKLKGKVRDLKFIKKINFHLVFI